MIAVYDNFFSNNVFQAVYERAKKIELHTAEEHIQKYGIGYWPGTRSFRLGEEDPLLNSIFCDTLHSHHIFHRSVIMLDSFVHLRLDDANEGDYVHSDPNDFSVVVYLSQTNLSSGTKFFFDTPESKREVEKKNLENDTGFVKCVQNRAVIFHGSIPHIAYNNHGSNIDNGRLTMNGFMNYV